MFSVSVLRLTLGTCFDRRGQQRTAFSVNIHRHIQDEQAKQFPSARWLTRDFQRGFALSRDPGMFVASSQRFRLSLSLPECGTRAREH